MEPRADIHRISKLDNRSLRYLAAAAEFASVSLAADHFGVSQPALSKAIGRLEQELGVGLLERSRGTVRATQAGELVLAYATQHRRDLAELLAGIEQIKTGRGGVLRVGATIDWAQEILPAALLALRAQVGELNATVLVLDSSELHGRLRDRDIDLFFGPVGPEELGPELNAQPFTQDWLGVYAGPDNPVHEAVAVSLAALRHYPWILNGTSTFMRRTLIRLFAAAGLPAPDPTLTSNSVPLIAELASQGPFLSFLSESVAAVHGESLRLINLPAARAQRLKGTVARAGESLSALHQALVERVRERVP